MDPHRIPDPDGKAVVLPSSVTPVSRSKMSCSAWLTEREFAVSVLKAGTLSVVESE